MKAELSHRNEKAKAVIIEAGKLAMSYFKTLDTLEIESKGVQDRVTEADRNVEKRIYEQLIAHFPEDGFLGEESGSHGQMGDEQFIWVVDPIDGTDCFVHGIPTWCISIGLVYGNQPVAGYIFHPSGNELFHACHGEGAFCNDIPIHTSDKKSMTDGLLGIGFSHRRDPSLTLEVLQRLLTAKGIFQRNGSAALTLAYVAAGRYLGFVESHINSWDVLAGLVIVREAGGFYSDFFAGDGLLKGNPIVAGATGIKEELMEIVQPIF